MKLEPIKNEKQYKAALAELEKVFDADPETAAGKKAGLLIILIEDYERNHYPIPEPDPIEAIRFYIEHKSHSLKDLTKVLGHKSRVTEILQRRRKLNLNMIRRLHTAWDMPLELLVSDYSLVKHRISRRRSSQTPQSGSQGTRTVQRT